jgi:hypothetical protein
LLILDWARESGLTRWWTTSTSSAPPASRIVTFELLEQACRCNGTSNGFRCGTGGRLAGRDR